MLFLQFFIFAAIVVLIISGYGGDRRGAFNIVVQFWWICGLLLLLLIYTVVKDEENVHTAVKASLLKSFGSIEAMNSTSIVEYGTKYSSTMMQSTDLLYATSVNPLAGVSASYGESGVDYQYRKLHSGSVSPIFSYKLCTY